MLTEVSRNRCTGDAVARRTRYLEASRVRLLRRFCM